jgi:hypothetical protein
VAPPYLRPVVIASIAVGVDSFAVISADIFGVKGIWHRAGGEHVSLHGGDGRCREGQHATSRSRW